MKYISTNEKVLYRIGCIFVFVVLVVGLVYKYRPEIFSLVMPCLFHTLTGFYCPGCGGTRAIFAFFQGDFLISFFYHPFVMYGIGVGGYFMGTHTIQRLLGNRWKFTMKFRNFYLWMALILICGNFLLKNLFLLYGIDLLQRLDQ